MAKAVWEVIRMTKMTKEAERVKNSERAPYTELELKELSKEELQGLYLGFYEKESGRLREPGLIKAILKFESKITDKETVRMTEKQNEEIEEFTEEYVSDEEKKLSEICQKANEIESCATVEEISEKLASLDKEMALDVCALMLGEERIRYPEPYSLKEYAEQILADRSLRESVEADMSDQMPKSIDDEIRDAEIKQNICLMECVNANQRYGMYKERAHQLRLELRMNRQYADTFKKSGYGVPEELRKLIASQTEEYHEMRIERFRSYRKTQECKEKYDEAESALNALERVKEELSA